MSIRDAWLLGAACAALLLLAALYVLERRHAVARGAEARDAHARAMRTPLVCVAMVAQAQTKMYKCTGDGRTIYQQTACASAAPAAAASAASDKPATPARAGGSRQAAPAVRSAGSGGSAGSGPAGSADTAGRLATSRP